MAKRDLSTIYRNDDFELMQEVLSDKSTVYSVWVKAEGAGAEIHCTSFEAANELFDLLYDRDKYYL